MAVCKECEKHLEPDEMAIYRRLVNRGAKEYLCIDCLATYFKCDRAVIEARITGFKEMGCTMFTCS